MNEVQQIIERIKDTEYGNLSNGEQLREMDFSELTSICQEMEQEIEELTA